MDELLKNGATRSSILDYFRSVAVQENTKIDSSPIELNQLIKNDGNKKAIFISNTSKEDLLLVLTLLKSFKDTNKDCDIFFATKPEFFPIVICNPYIYKCIPYQDGLEDERSMLASNLDKGSKYFDHFYNFNKLLRDHEGVSIENNLFKIYE